MNRRTILHKAGAGLVGGALALAWRGGARARAAVRYAVSHTDAEWRRLLSPGQFDVLRRAGTEAPGSSSLDHQFARGRYDCAGCAQALFASDTKFDSGTGWPSFWAPLPHAVDTSDDESLFMQRTEVHCSRCGGHLGHVFDDGPKPTGLRYCMNGIAMSFAPSGGNA